MLAEEVSVTRIEVEPSLLARNTLARLDYLDTFRAPVPLGTAIDAAHRAFASSPPAWVRSLMTVRDRAVSAFGLKTQASGELFRVIARDDHEIVLGEDDRHLDFRISLRVIDEDESAWLLLSTLVELKNVYGKAYFAVVRPFHTRVVPAMLRHMLDDKGLSGS